MTLLSADSWIHTYLMTTYQLFPSWGSCSFRLSQDTTAMGSPYKSPACPSTHFLLQGKSNIDIISPMKFSLVWTTCFCCKPANWKKEFLKHGYDRLIRRKLSFRQKILFKFCSISAWHMCTFEYICAIITYNFETRTKEHANWKKILTFLWNGLHTAHKSDQSCFRKKVQKFNFLGKTLKLLTSKGLKWPMQDEGAVQEGGVATWHAHLFAPPLHTPQGGGRQVQVYTNMLSFFKKNCTDTYCLKYSFSFHEM